jgi:hypothetical protein
MDVMGLDLEPSGHSNPGVMWALGDFEQVDECGRAFPRDKCS